MIPWAVLKEEYLKPIGGALLLPYVLYREIKEQIDLWKTRTHAPLGGKAGGTGELKVLIDRLGQYKEEAPVLRERLCQGVIEKLFTDSSSAVALASKRLISDLIAYEGFLTVPDIDLASRTLSTSERWETTGALVRVLDSFEKPDALAARFETLLRDILLDSDLCTREAKTGEEAMFSVPLYALLPNPVMAVERILSDILGEVRIDSRFFHLWPQLEQNLLMASGIDPSGETKREPVWPSKARMEIEEIIAAYLGNTPFAAFLQASVPFDAI
jgi:hypothetical protein